MRLGVEDVKEAKPTTSPKSRPRWLVVFVIVVISVFGALAVRGIQGRLSARADLNSAAKDSARLPVAVVHPHIGDSGGELVLPGNVQAFLETPIYARTNGYLKRWHVDIGGRVREGELLAEIETPEVDQELRQAEAAEAQAEANLELARATAERWRMLLKVGAVSQQEVDQNVAAYEARKADVLGAKANVQRLRELQSFKGVVAPFAGIVTARNVDVGALIANGSALPLFHLAETNPLRVYVNVPQSYSRSIMPGLPTELLIREFPDRTFPGKVVRTAGAIDPSSRTLLTQIQVPNPTGEILPGAYGTVRFHLKVAEPPLIVPSNTVVFRSEGTEVAAVDEQGRVHLHRVTLGRDLGTSLEVLSGLRPAESLVLNPPDSIAEGDSVIVTQQGPSPPSPR